MVAILGLELATLDIVILSFVFIGLAYYFLTKKKNKPQYDFAPISSARVGLERRMSEAGFIAKLKKQSKNIVIFYGSQTGTAEDLANRLAKDCVRYGMKAVVMDPEECDMEEMTELSEVENSLAIFCMATYGEGDPTDNAQEFFEFLQRGETELNGVSFAVFGLGNKTYEHFNEMGQYTDKRLEDMGAKRVYQAGTGDDDGNLEEDFMIWREGFWPAVCDFFDITNIAEDIDTRQYKVTLHEEYDDEKVFRGEIARLKSYDRQRPPFDTKNPYLSPIKENRLLNAGGDRTFLHIEFDITDSKIRYEAGDHVAVYPTNDGSLVDRIAKVLGPNTDLDAVFTLTNVDEDSSKRHPFPCPTSFRTALLHYVDIVAPPKTNVLKELAAYCGDPVDKEWLLSMTSAKPESRKAYNEEIMIPRRSIVDILEDRTSCKPSLDHLCELMPRLQPRYYSISSSPKVDPTIIAITLVVTRYTTSLGRTVNGVATTWLQTKVPVPTESLFPKVPIFVRKSTLRLPHQPKTPVIMIGPGTGLAPFRGFIMDRVQQKSAGKEVGSTVLYYGCRKEKEDHIYADQMEQWKESGALDQLNIAFSRDGPQKDYVQHHLQRNAAEMWKLIQDGAHIYVCGDARNMAKDVLKCLLGIFGEHGSMTEEEAQKFLKKLESQKRYQADVWS